MPIKQYQKALIGSVVLLLAICFVYLYSRTKQPDEASSSISTLFTCKDSKSITAVFSAPTASSSVELTLSDGRTFTLPQAISASGARYANTDETFVFWNKGDTAFITEGVKKLETYTDCMAEKKEAVTIATTTPSETQPKTPATVTATTKPKPATTLGSNLLTYSNAEYKFQVKFPKSVLPQNYFTTFYQLPSSWRLNASAVNQGKAIVSFPVYRIDQGELSAKGKTYPLYFIAETRIGAGPNVKECYAPDAGYTNQKITNVTINGIAFKKFDFADAAMMKYTQGSSYRTIHNNMCYVIEQIKSGSSYKDETMTQGISENQLQSYYDTAGAIVRTFTFTK
jgi:membrane-bound inhibitor of C-type lysozyme